MTLSARIAFTALDEDAVVLCATHRLGHDLRREHDRRQMARGLRRWPSLQAPTIAQWLDARLDEALLDGALAVDAAPRLRLDAMQENILWQRAIDAVIVGEGEGEDEEGGRTAEAFFDHAGMARAAAEAHALMTVWNIRPGDAGQSEETRQFLRWREAFLRICGEACWLDAARYLDWQIGALSGGAGRLPRQIAFAGFDRYNPQEQRLARILAARGVAVFELEQGLAESAAVREVALPDRLAECRAAAAWAGRRLAERPGARLGIVVPELAALRETLAALLDDALDPAAFDPALAEMPRHYNFSLGLPLDRQPLVATALQWLGLAAHPQRIAQEEFGALLRQPFWSADIAEADGRARLDVRLREKMPGEFSLEHAWRFVRKVVSGGEGRGAAGMGIPVPRLLASLDAVRAVLAGQPARQRHSEWAALFRRILDAAGWPGERVLSSHEFQARRAFDKAFDALAELDAVQGRAGFGEACRHLRQLCRERIFQPQTEGEPPVQVMGLLEAAGTPLDELWVMGMNDHLWPPAARPNPLLPAELQRRARSPNASAEVQGEFAAVIQRRLLRSAPQAILSWARGEADRVLRPSPLLGCVAGREDADDADWFVPARPGPLAALAGGAVLETCVDRQAPPLAEGERIRGGTALLRAQALCPAWAFYRYRLGARRLEAAVETLDAAARGTLLHAALQAFWSGRGSAALAAMTPETRTVAVADAVAQALRDFDAARELPLPPRLHALEAERLQRLLAVWLDCEAQRGPAFHVIACEEEIELEIEGIAVKLKIDRIDALDGPDGPDDGRRMVLDYKTGGSISQASWGEARIGEPQLPVYAAFALDREAAPPVAVAFARVRMDDCGFVGIAAEAGLLPKVAGIGDTAARKLFPAQGDWPALLEHWRSRIAAIAREIRAGEAGVSFRDEKELAWCEVLPLLRLAEYRAQREAQEHSDA